MPSIKRLLFLGSKSLGLRSLETLEEIAKGYIIGTIILDDRDDTRSQFENFRTFTKRSKIPLTVVRDRSQAKAAIIESKADLCFVSGWYWLFDCDVLAAVPNGFIGLHPSLLPQYRGGAPLVWSMINGEPFAGMSLFKLDDGMDEGGIWAQCKVPINQDDYIGDVLTRLEDASVDMLREVFPGVLHGTRSPVDQDQQDATYCAPRRPIDGAIDWRWPAQKVLRFIRAQSDPYSGAFTYGQEGRLTIWRADGFGPKYFSTPGQVIRISADGVLVACGDNRAIVVREVGIKGERIMAHEAVRSIATRFSPASSASWTDDKPFESQAILT